MKEKDKNCQDNNVGNNGGNGRSKKDPGLKQTDNVWFYLQAEDLPPKGKVPCK